MFVLQKNSNTTCPPMGLLLTSTRPTWTQGVTCGPLRALGELLPTYKIRVWSLMLPSGLPASDKAKLKASVDPQVPY